MTTQPCITLSERCIEIAAGVPVNADAYQRWDLNLMRVSTMGRAFQRGWLHNVLGRITPLTAYSREDYLAMADLFITNTEQAQQLASKLSQDLSAFAQAAGLSPSASSTPAQLVDHVALYRGITSVLEQKFNFTAPQPFAEAKTNPLQGAAFIRSYMQQHALN